MSYTDESVVAEPRLEADAEAAPLTREDLVPFVIQGAVDELSKPDEDGDPATKVAPGFGRSDTVELEKSKTHSSIRWPHKKDLLGVEVSVTDYDELVRLCVSAARRGEPGLATFLPVHGIVTAALDHAYRYRVNAFDVVAPDGQPVRWALNLLHHARLPDRVCGPRMMERLCARAAEQGIGIYLYGSTIDTLDRLKNNLEDQFPALRIVGVESPPFRELTPEENQAAVDRINISGAGFVFIGLGCPRQDLFAHFNRNRIKALQLCVGAAFDFHAGNKKIAPLWMQKSGLEWIYRLGQEPGRLWKRYLLTNTAFVLLMTRRLLSGR
jgi:N-acetylglucosaminyldiphosphoundecaprenol N-acetyl-beta-D-mannosaminyltransferase